MLSFRSLLLIGITFSSAGSPAFCSGHLDVSNVVPTSDFRYVRQSSSSSFQRQRFEPTRPSYSQTRNVSRWGGADRLGPQATRNRLSKRYEPTRPKTTFDDRSAPAISQTKRYEPTRPNRSQDFGSSSFAFENYQEPSSSREKGSFSPFESYEQGMSGYGKYETLNSGYQNYQESRGAGRRIRKMGRMICKPVESTFKFSRKAVSNISFGWLPFL